MPSSQRSVAPTRDPGSSSEPIFITVDGVQVPTPNGRVPATWEGVHRPVLSYEDERGRRVIAAIDGNGVSQCVAKYAYRTFTFDTVEVSRKRQRGEHHHADALTTKQGEEGPQRRTRKPYIRKSVDRRRTTTCKYREFIKRVLSASNHSQRLSLAEAARAWSALPEDSKTVKSAEELASLVRR